MSKGYNKKLIAPAIALMMCAVAFIGIGYALTSSVQSGSNNITLDELTIDLSNDYGTISTAKTVSESTTNGLFSGKVTVTNNKTGTQEGDGKTYSYDSHTYLRVFDESSYNETPTKGNATLKIKSDAAGAGLKVVIYGTDGDGNKVSEDPVGTLNSTTINYPETSISIETNTVYYVAIEGSPTGTNGGAVSNFTLFFQVNGS